MVCLGAQLIGYSHKCIGLGLQFPAAALLDFSRPFSQPGEESIHLVAHLSGP